MVIVKEKKHFTSKVALLACHLEKMIKIKNKRSNDNKIGGQVKKLQLVIT